MPVFECLPSCEYADCSVPQCQATFMIAPCDACESGPKLNGLPTPDWNKYQLFDVIKVSFEPEYNVKKKGRLGTCGGKRAKVRLIDYGGSFDIEHCQDDEWHKAMLLSIRGVYFAWALFPFPAVAGSPNFATDFAFYGDGIVSGAAKEYDADNDEDEQQYTYPWTSAGKELGLWNAEQCIDCSKILDYDAGLNLQEIVDQIISNTEELGQEIQEPEEEAA